MVKLAIFDLDGTLLNTLDDLGDSCNYILTKHNLPTHPIDVYRKFVGHGVKKLVDRALPIDKKDPEFIEQLRNEFIEYYNQHSEDKTTPYENIIELLQALEQKGIVLAIASNKYHEGVEHLVKKYFGNIKFGSVLGQREGIPAKPNPQIVYDTIQQTGITNKNEIIYIGDADADMQTAANAKIESIGVLWGFRTKEELLKNGAAYLAKQPMDILKIIENKG